MCTSHLTADQASELIDTALNDLEAFRAAMFESKPEIRELLMAAIVQNLVKVRDGYVNVHGVARGSPGNGTDPSAA